MDTIINPTNNRQKIKNSKNRERKDHNILEIVEVMIDLAQAIAVVIVEVTTDLAKAIEAVIVEVMIDLVQAIEEEIVVVTIDLAKAIEAVIVVLKEAPVVS